MLQNHFIFTICLLLCVLCRLYSLFFSVDIPLHVLVELGIDAKEALELLQLVRDSNKEQEADVTALDLLQIAVDYQPIVSFSEQLDTLLDGGVPLGKMTEFCGAPGVGKTQLW